MATPKSKRRESKVLQGVRCALETVKSSTAFVVHRVEHPCRLYGPFSSLSLGLIACTNTSQTDMSRVALRFEQLFKVEATERGEGENFIHTCKKTLWPVFHASPSYKDTERSVLLEIVSEILVKLGCKVTMEKRFHKALEAVLARDLKMSRSLSTSALGLGSTKTWHGTPDLRVRGVVFCEKSEEEVSDSESEDKEDKSSVSSDGMATNFEGKIKFRASNLPQVVATCVVSSFTESSRHPDKSPLIPTVLIDRLSYLVCLYDCERDVLLISNKKSLCTKGHLSRSGIALLWVVLNHR